MCIFIVAVVFIGITVSAQGFPFNCATYGNCSKTQPPSTKEKSTTTQIPRTSSGKFRTSEATTRINPRLSANSGTSTGRSSDPATSPDYYTPYYTPTIFSVTTRNTAKASGRDNSQKGSGNTKFVSLACLTSAWLLYAVI